METNFWKVTLRYGHVGHSKEISVNRYLQFPSRETIIDVQDFAQTMPGVKSRGVVFIQQVTRNSYEKGKEEEEENFYLRKLKNYTEQRLIH